MWRRHCDNYILRQHEQLCGYLRGSNHIITNALANWTATFGYFPG